MTSPEPSPGPSGRTRIGDRQRDGPAIVYVRQPSMNQVQHHRESTQLQYGLVDRAGGSAGPGTDRGHRRRPGQKRPSAEGRPGFQRLLAEVALDHVGLVLGLEMSRLARSCKDWHQLLELCAPLPHAAGRPGRRSTTRPTTTTGCCWAYKLHEIRHRELHIALRSAFAADRPQPRLRAM